MSVPPEARLGPVRRVGVLGGTFDPPHLGHLAAAQEALELLGLESVLFVPARQNPLKDAAATASEHRVRMTELAIAGDPRFVLSLADIERPGPSYTVDLLAALAEVHGEGTELVFVVGTDSLVDLHRWREPSRLLRLASIAAISRPHHPAPRLAFLETRVPGAAKRITVVETPGVALSSTELRARLAQGRSVRYLVPDPVERYIREQRLYGTGRK
ncbi:MAG: nicotinate-nucleotide adenylyltransferase [Chloroflexota bacterium]